VSLSIPNFFVIHVFGASLVVYEKISPPSPPPSLHNFRHAQSKDFALKPSVAKNGSIQMDAAKPPSCFLLLLLLLLQPSSGGIFRAGLQRG